MAGPIGKPGGKSGASKGTKSVPRVGRGGGKSTTTRKKLPTSDASAGSPDESRKFWFKAGFIGTAHPDSRPPLLRRKI